MGRFLGARTPKFNGREQVQHSTRLKLLCTLCIAVSLLVKWQMGGRELLAASPEGRLVWLPFKSPAEVQAWVDQGFDVWHVEDQRALVRLSPAQFSRLQEQQVSYAPAPNFGTPAFPACYRRYPDMLVFFREMQARYPNLFRLYDVGDSWETTQGEADRDIYVARLTNVQTPGDKPRLFLAAAHHAREIVTTEVALMFIEDLLANYDRDPQIRWLLDKREIWVMPMVNPDGRARAANLENWRKNTNQDQPCANGQPPNSDGVDLNRNYGYQWGLDIGSSSNPCNLTYRGSAPFSEPETRAVRDLMTQQRFDIFISLHAYGNTIMYPWGYTYHPAPDTENLHRVANRMAQEAGYSPMQSFGIGYLSSGDATDWAYGELGIPSFTFELGGIEDGAFWPSCAKRRAIYDEVRDSLVYAAVVADDPYQRANGPDIRQLAWRMEADEGMAVNAQASDMWNGGDVIEQMELFFDELGEPGQGVQATPADMAFNSAREWGVFRFAPAEVPADASLMYVRARDSQGYWGPPKIVALRWPPTDRVDPTLTPVPPTATPVPPTATPVPPTATPTPTPTLIPPTPIPEPPQHSDHVVYLPFLSVRR